MLAMRARHHSARFDARPTLFLAVRVQRKHALFHITA